MAHAFDNRKCIHEKQRTFYSSDSPVLSPHDMKNNRYETSTSSQLSSRANHLSLEDEETIVKKVRDDHRRQQLRTNEYLRDISANHNGGTKPPPPARTPRITSTTNNNYIRRSNVFPQYAMNGVKTNRTYLNTTQLYISQGSCEDHPPPPPPRYPLHPPAIPPRNPLNSNQKNSIIIPDFNSPTSPKTIYRSPVLSPVVKSRDFNDQIFPELHLKPLTVDTGSLIQETANDSTVGEYFGECRKCGETITSSDDPCDLLGQIYHGSCAACVVCGQSVKNKHFYIKDHLYCEDDFLNMDISQRFEHCVACNGLINDTIIQALGETYHFACFKCSKCFVCLDGRSFVRDKNRNLFCLRDYHLTHGPRCDACRTPILPEDDSNETVRIMSMGKSFHVECYQCEDCRMQLSDEQDRRCCPLDDALLCHGCYLQRLLSVNKF